MFLVMIIAIISSEDNAWIYYGAFTLDVESVLNENPRWHPRWHAMLDS
jgi:hypothetical protein